MNAIRIRLPSPLISMMIFMMLGLILLKIKQVPQTQPSHLHGKVQCQERLISSKRIISSNRKLSVAIALGITTKLGYDWPTKVMLDLLDWMPIFAYFLPTFCSTAETGYIYHFYMAHDHNDVFFKVMSNMKLFKERFINITKSQCHHLDIINLHMVKVLYSGKPAWAQNDAVMAAYKDGRDFFYRVNDDTMMISTNWTHILIGELRKMVPPLVGVVGPTDYGGYTNILTYDFVHRTHIDIFGYHYPREFFGWYGDNWITRVYLPNRSTKLKSVTVNHVHRYTRYEIKKMNYKLIATIIRQTASKLKK